MAREKAPAFQFYPKDWQSDERVKLMSHTERGIYIDLLCHCWLEGSLPGDVTAIARIVHQSQARFSKSWDGPLGQCFYLRDDGRWSQKRLDIERQKQHDYRRRQSDKGRTSAQARFNRGSTVVASRLQPEVNSSSSSSVFNLQKAKEPDARSKRPVFTGQRLTVFEWMLDDHMKILTTHTDSFDLHEWYFALDARMLREDLIQPKRDSGAWVESELVAEAQRRGISLRIASAPSAGKLTTRMASALANTAREDEA